MSSAFPIGPALTAGEPNLPSDVPNARSATPQATTHGPKIKTVKVKAHTRTVTTKPKTSAPKTPATPQTNPFMAEANLRYGPQIDALTQQVANQQYNQGRAQHWYDDYTNMLKAQQAAQNVAAQNVAAALGAYNPQVAQTGNPQADALAQQAQQSQKYLGQSFAGTQSQMALDTANRFATGLIPAAGLSGQQAQQNFTNTIGQLLQKKGDVQAQKVDYANTLQSKAQAQQQKVATDNAKIQAALLIAQGKTDMAAKVLQSLNQDRQSKNSIARSNVRTQRINAKTTRGNLVERQNEFNLKKYVTMHPELKTKGGRVAAGKSPFTPTQTRKAAATFRTLAATMDEGPTTKNPAGAVDALVKGKKVDPVVANAVVESIVNGGSVTRATATAYFRATGHHLHVSPNAKTISGSALSNLLTGETQKLAGSLKVK